MRTTRTLRVTLTTWGVLLFVRASMIVRTKLFVAIEPTVALDEKVSIEAKGLYYYLASINEEVDTNDEPFVAAALGITCVKLETLISELIGHGYLNEL